MNFISSRGRVPPFRGDDFHLCVKMTLLLSQPIFPVSPDCPSQPALLLDPPSGEVVDGDPLLLTCVANGPTAQRKFFFYKDGAEQFSEMATKDRSLFNIPEAKATIATGRFTCRYEERVSDTWISSPFSQTMVVLTQGEVLLPTQSMS